MELMQRTMQIGDVERSIIHQFHLSEDVNVPDSKEDIVRVLQGYGNLHIEKVIPVDQYLQIKGLIEYQILYATADEDKRIACMEGKVEVEEMVYVEGNVQAEIRYHVKCNQLDFHTSVIHSRKCSLKALVELEVQRMGASERVLTVDAGGAAQNDLEELSTKNNGVSGIANGNVLTKHKAIPILELCAMKKDTYRIREEVKLPSTKENIGSIILARMGNTKLETRVGNEELLLHGEMELFCMYISDEWKEDYISQTVSFEGRVDCPQMEEGMFDSVCIMV